METIIQQGVIGIITGILTTVTLFSIKLFWTAKVTPFLISIRYQGVSIAGQWSGTEEITENKEKPEVKPFRAEQNLFLSQNGHNLLGSFMFKYKSTSQDYTIDFNVIGYMWEGYLTLNFTPKDKRITSYATALLKLHGGGQELIGRWLFRDVKNECVTQTDLTLSRDIK